jgi:CubicO group peptidase (beta-lactamase class C family)
VSRVLPRSTPEDQGVSSAAVRRFVDALESGVPGMHSVMLLRHGHVIAEGWWHPYAEQLPHALFSISKSFTSTAVGFAIHDGLLSLDDRVVDLLRDDAPDTIGDNLAAMTVRHLLTMTTGHAVDSVDSIPDDEPDWTRALLALPVPLEPGTRFVYDSGASYLLSAIVQGVAGQRLLDYLAPRLFEPLGIVGATWEQSPNGIDAGGWGLSITTENIAAFGQTYLDGGRFGGAQVVPADWVAEATALQVETGDHRAGNDDEQGYGYQFWRCQHGAYRADGAFGQVSVALPEHDALLVLTGGHADKQRALTLAWEHLLPVLGAREPLPADAVEHSALTGRLARLGSPLPIGDPHSPLAATVGGRLYAFPGNAGHLGSAALDFAADADTLTVVDAFGEHRVRLGRDRWATGTSALIFGAPAAVAAVGTWTDASSYLVEIRFVETPFAVSLSFDFRGDEVTLGVDQNVAFGDTQLLRTVGRTANSKNQE